MADHVSKRHKYFEVWFGYLKARLRISRNNRRPKVNRPNCLEEKCRVWD